MNNTNKTPHSCERGVLFGWDGWARTIEMPESKSGALPLGYIPITLGILSHTHKYVKKNLEKTRWFTQLYIKHLDFIPTIYYTISLYIIRNSIFSAKTIDISYIRCYNLPC